MSLKPVPVCNNCTRGTEVSISCTKCFQICCATCFNVRNDLFEAATTVTDRLCPKCGNNGNDNATNIFIKPEPMEQSSVDIMARELCKLHGKPQKLFCLNCSVCICGDCLVEDEAHELHHIANLVVVYQEKLAEVVQKVAHAQKLVAGFAVYEKNLEVLEKEEESVLKAVSVITSEAIFGVSCMTTTRKATLKDKVEFLVDNGKRLSELREMIKQLSAEKFMTQRSEIDRQCDDMITRCAANNVALQPVDDIKCDLVPAYNFARFTPAGFTTATSSYVYKMYSAYDVTWNVTVSNLKTVQVMLRPTDSEISKFPHKLIVIIQNADSTKEIRKTFDLGGLFHTFAIVQVSHLTEHGFFNASGDFMLKVGVRPLDALVEKRLLNYNCEKLKIECSSLKKQLGTITTGFDYKYHTNHFKLSLYKLETTHERSSLHVGDNDGRLWGMKVCLSMVYLCPTQVQAYVVLIKGTSTNCNYFIELKHENAQKTVLKSKTSYFNQRAAIGWECFISWNDILAAGYHQGGNLRFRYGVKPLQTN